MYKNDKEKYGLTTFQAIVLLLLEAITKKQWCPEEIIPEPPEPPTVPEYVKPFGDVSRYIGKYCPNDWKAVYRTIGQVSVFFSDPRQVYEVVLGNGTTAEKHVFSARTSSTQSKMLNVPANVNLLTYFEKIPTSTRKVSRAYADGEPMIEICDPAGGAIRFRDVVLIGHQRSDGSWMDDSAWLEE